MIRFLYAMNLCSIFYIVLRNLRLRIVHDNACNRSQSLSNVFFLDIMAYEIGYLAEILP